MYYCPFGNCKTLSPRAWLVCPDIKHRMNYTGHKNAAKVQKCKSAEIRIYSGVKMAMSDFRGVDRFHISISEVVVDKNRLKLAICPGKRREKWGGKAGHFSTLWELFPSHNALKVGIYERESLGTLMVPFLYRKKKKSSFVAITIYFLLEQICQYFPISFRDVFQAR